MFKHPVRNLSLWAIVIVLLVTYCLSDLFAQQVNPAQEQVERTIGSLVIGNATCTSTNAALASELDKVRKELVALKAVQAPAEPKTEQAPQEPAAPKKPKK